MKKNISLALLLMISCVAHAQIDSSKHSAIIEGKDTIPYFSLAPVDIIDAADPAYQEKLKAYYRLRFNVLKVYPYAKLAAVKLKEINDHLATLTSEKEKRKYSKQAEEQMKNDFEKTLKNLSMNQGKVLVKLIDRETGHTSYELIQQMRGNFEALIWQTTAQIFNNNLKAEYDPYGEDKTIESIVQQIEAGELQGN